MANTTASFRYHIRIFDDSGAEFDINNLSHSELDEFRQSHASDDLDYRIIYAHERPQKFHSSSNKPSGA